MRKIEREREREKGMSRPTQNGYTVIIEMRYFLSNSYCEALTSPVTELETGPFRRLVGLNEIVRVRS